MREDHKKLLAKLHNFLNILTSKPLSKDFKNSHSETTSLLETEKKLSVTTSNLFELQMKFTDRDREFKSLQKTNILYEKRVEELQQKISKLRSEYQKMMNEESVTVKLKDQLISDAKFKFLDLEKSYKEIKKYFNGKITAKLVLILDYKII